MNDRLEKLFFLEPEINTPWTGPPPERRHPPITRADGRQIEIQSGLFWYDPPWFCLTPEQADQLATAVAGTGILVSAMARDLGGNQGLPRLLSPISEESEDSESAESSSSVTYLPRIAPYRPERYGLSDEDFDGPLVVDVRLTMNRDTSGRFAYSAIQMERWEATPSGQPVSGGSWVPSATFPPDVASISHLENKLSQLRELAPNAAVFVSLNPLRTNQELPQVIKAKPDGIILRLDLVPASGLELATFTLRTREFLDQLGATETPLWIVPGTATPDDAAKLVSLGATAVAVDSWCETLPDRVNSESNSAASRLGYSALSASRGSQIDRMVMEELGPDVDRFYGLIHSLQVMGAGPRMSSYCQEYRDALGLDPFGLPPSSA